METFVPVNVTLDHFALFIEPPATPSETVTAKLDRLAFNRDGIASLEALRKEIVDVACAGIRALLDGIDTAMNELKDTATGLESEIKEAVLIDGASAKGTLLHAIFNRGRVSYDAKGLDALAVLVPEVLNFRKEGEPSVAIREVKAATKERSLS